MFMCFKTAFLLHPIPLPSCFFSTALSLFKKKWRDPAEFLLRQKLFKKRQVYVAEIVVRHTKRRTYRWSHGSLGRGIPPSWSKLPCRLAGLAGGLTFFFWGWGNDGLMAFFLMGLMMGWWVFRVDDVNIVVFHGVVWGGWWLKGIPRITPFERGVLLKGVSLRIPNHRDPNQRLTISWMMEMQECRILQKQLLALNGFDLHVFDWSLVQ